MTPPSYATVVLLRRFAACLFIVSLAAACQREASAQAIRRDPLGPIGCFNIVDDLQLSEDSAVRLCSGAISDAPGHCYAQAIDRFHELSQQKVLDLCARATSTEPAECYGRLAATGELTEDQIIAYCTVFCPIGPPPPESSSPSCLSDAVNLTDLALQSAGELCLGSSSSGPVQCFLAGQNMQQVADTKLIDLCAEVQQCQYYGGYGSTTPTYSGVSPY